MTKPLHALWAIERAKSFAAAASILPGDVFDAEAGEAERLIQAGAARPAEATDIAVAEATGRRFTAPAADSVTPVLTTLTKPSAKASVKPAATDAPLV